MKKLLMRLLMLLISVVLVLSMTGCPLLFEEIYKSIKYPFNVDEFRNTKWVCKDLDMYFYISDFGIFGQYTDGDDTYYLDGYGADSISFDVFPMCDEILENSRYVDENGNSYIHKDEIFKYPRKGYVDFDTMYIDGVLELSVSFSDIGFWEDREDSDLTFKLEYDMDEDETDTILWHCSELKMNITPYDNSGFYMGDITFPDKKYRVFGVQVGKDVYDFKIKELFEDAEFYSPTDLVQMRIRVIDGKLCAEIFDSHLINPKEYPFWNFSKSQYTFEKVETK